MIKTLLAVLIGAFILWNLPVISTFVIVGILIGWSFPEPEWAHYIRKRVIVLWHRIRKALDEDVGGNPDIK